MVTHSYATELVFLVNTRRVNNGLTLPIRCWQHSQSGVLQLPRHARQRRHEADLDEFLALDPGLAPAEAGQRLNALMRADRRDQDAADLEPPGQVLRNLLTRGGDDDAVERADIGRQVEAVAQHHLDIVVAELLKPGARGIREPAVALDRQ